jgi:hypothetical protein
MKRLLTLITASFFLASVGTLSGCSTEVKNPDTTNNSLADSTPPPAAIPTTKPLLDAMCGDTDDQCNPENHTTDS